MRGVTPDSTRLSSTERTVLTSGNPVESSLRCLVGHGALLHRQLEGATDTEPAISRAPDRSRNGRCVSQADLLTVAVCDEASNRRKA